MEHDRKRAGDDLPAVHKSAPTPGKSGRDTPGKAAALEHAELQRLAEQLRTAHTAQERAAVIAAIEHRFGSATADRLVAELARQTAGPKPAGPPGSPPHPGGHE